MIAPEFRQCSPWSLKAKAQNYIEQNHGTDLWNTVQPLLQEMDAVKAELQHAPAFKSDVEQLKKFQECFAKNYQNAMLLNKYFSFGTGNLQINMKFSWHDSFQPNTKVESFSPLLEALSSKYNYAVTLARQACYMPLEGDGIKYASKYMQQAAWLFNDLATNVTQLKPGEVSPDFTAEALGMLSNLMLAQSQYLFYKMATEKKMKPEVLSKVALQISFYFKEAYSHSQTNRVLKAFQNGQFAGILIYHQKYFEASAWHVLGVHRFQEAKDQGRDMGHAAGTAVQAEALFNAIGPITANIPADYRGNYQNKLKQAQQLSAMAADKAKTVFFEQITPPAQVKMPDAKNFVKFDDGANAVLLEVPHMDDTFRYIVPPQVRNMQSEFKTIIQNMIDQKYKANEKADLEQRAFYGQFQLPQSYHDLTTTDDIPAMYWNKIEEFQKKGALANFQNSISGMAGFKSQAESMIAQAEQKINKEEQEDAQLRATFGAKWPLPQSTAINGPYKNNINMYKQKLDLASQQDQHTAQVFTQQSGDLQLLTKTKHELLAEIPAPTSINDVSAMPAAVAVKQALDNHEQARTKRDAALKEAVEHLSNLSMIEDLLKVHQQQKQKEEVFGEQRAIFDEYWKRMSEQEALSKAANDVITQTWTEFSKLKQSIQIDPTRQAFFLQIDSALMSQQDLENMIHQGNEFYNRLIDHLTTLTTNVTDYKFGRNLQMTEQCKALGAQPPNFDDGPGGPPAGMPPAGGPPGGAPGGAPQAPPVNYEFEIFDPTTMKH